MPYIKKASKNM